MMLFGSSLAETNQSSADSSSASKSNVLGDNFVLEIQDGAMATPQPASEEISITIGGNQPRPGEVPQINVITIQTQAEIIFPSPMSGGDAKLFNPSSANMIVVYVLRISVAELMSQTGMTGYSQEAYEELSSQEGFDPADSFITLSQTKGVVPGDYVSEITLGALPDGSTLPAGSYVGELVMVPFDADTSIQSGIRANIDIPFTIEMDSIQLTCDADYQFPIKAFNSLDSETDIVYSIQLSQAEIKNVTGSPHRTATELKLQKESGIFYPEYEFISLFTSEPIAPGAFLESATLGVLPDGQSLPSGTYTAWLVRNTIDPDTGALTIMDANTQIELIVP